LLLLKSNKLADQHKEMESKDIIEHLNLYFSDDEEKLLLSKSNVLSGFSAISEGKLLTLMQIIAYVPPAIDSRGFSQWVQRSRDVLKLKQSDLANLIALGRDRINKLEKGTSNLSEEKATQLRELLIARLRSENLL
jgi:DNA-binding XRE family transcriptional regulator